MEYALRLLDLINFVERLDERATNAISLSEPEERLPKKSPFIYRFNDVAVDFILKYGIIESPRRSPSSRIVTPLCDFEPRRIGYIFVERGCEDDNCSEATPYEAMSLRFKQPIDLKDGTQIPRCNIKLFVAQPELSASEVMRRDHERVGRIIWKRDDLSGFLPTEWFLK